MNIRIICYPPWGIVLTARKVSSLRDLVTCYQHDLYSGKNSLSKCCCLLFLMMQRILRLVVECRLYIAVFVVYRSNYQANSFYSTVHAEFLIEIVNVVDDCAVTDVQIESYFLV